ncbi:MAG: biopolymer transporter ExbD [Planctomycetales bacterium 12-60-4]|nr:MAG: biopolymer transporter ExbD [Planctomycetales bacterium 12-60-4]
MKFIAQSPDNARVQVPMAPMIDITFQLLIFFMLNLVILAPEGEFQVQMLFPPAKTVDRDWVPPVLKVRLQSDAAGNLTQVTLGNNNLGNDAAAFDRLTGEIAKVVQPGNPLTKDVEVEIDADYQLKYEYIIKAVSHCSGRFDPQTKQMVRYIGKIKFAPPRPQQANS